MVLRLPLPLAPESGRMGTVTIRPAGVDDLEPIIANLMAGFATFTEFAPAGWQPPEPRRERTAELLAHPRTWAALALDGSRVVGHVSFTPARGRPFEQPAGAWREEPPIPGKAHLWQLFVLPDSWGSGVATALHARCLEAMADQEYDRARLYTPLGNDRARRFYEREGWRYTAEGPDNDMKLAIAEYEIELSRR
jgi:ribosomal protein S18 acetylase RimI-like enzyme